MNFEQAIYQIKCGKKVCRWNWISRYVYAKSIDSEVLTNDGVRLHISDYEATDWQIYQLGMRDIKIGEKFYLISHKKTYIRVTSPKEITNPWMWYVNVETGELCHTLDSDRSHVERVS